MAFSRALLDELEHEAQRQLGCEASRFLAELAWPVPNRRVSPLRAEDLWVDYWDKLAAHRPDLFAWGLRRDIAVAEALAYLYVRKQYPDWLPPLRLKDEERQLLRATRARIAAWTGLPALGRPAPRRLVRTGCPILEQERITKGGRRNGATFAWAPSLRRVVLIYEDYLVEKRQEGCPHLLVGTVLHEESHSARLLAAGQPSWTEDSEITYWLDELAAMQIGFLAQLMAKIGRVPTRQELERWNELQWPGTRINRLCRLWPKAAVPDLVGALTDLTVSALQLQGERRVFALLDARSRRRHTPDHWRSLLYG